MPIPTAVAVLMTVTACTGAGSTDDPRTSTAPTVGAEPTETSFASSPEPTIVPTPTRTRTPTATPTATEDTAFGGNASACTNEVLGFSVSYPADWWANEPVEADEPVADVAGCTYFAPEPVTIEPGTDDLAGIAIRFDVIEREVEPSGEILTEDATTVDGHEARVIEFEPDPQPGFIEEGERIYRYKIDLPNGEQLFVTTDTINQDEDRYAEARQVLDAMMETLEIDA